MVPPILLNCAVMVVVGHRPCGHALHGDLPMLDGGLAIVAFLGGNGQVEFAKVLEHVSSRGCHVDALLLIV